MCPDICCKHICQIPSSLQIDNKETPNYINNYVFIYDPEVMKVNFFLKKCSSTEVFERDSNI